MSEETKNLETAAAETQAETAAETITEQNLDQMVTLKKGDIVKGTVIKIEDNQAYVSLGYKYDGVIPLRELSAVQLDNAADAVQVGQELELKVISIDDDKERLVLSKRQVDAEKAWDRLQEQFEKGEVLEVTVADVVKGGLVADVGVRGFIPASMVERHYVEDFSSYKGRTLRVKIKELDRETNKVILSAKEVLEEEYEANKRRIMESLEPGQIIEGTVQRLTPFGAFVDIGGIDGLVHVSELAWEHVAHPRDVVSEGQQVKVKVLKVDPEAGKISLSIKAAQPGPWELAADKFHNGDIVTGTVKRIVSFGAFVEVAPGVEGLVHISQIAHRHIATPHEVLKEGQEVKAKVLDFNPAEKRISLSIKETEEAPEQPSRSERNRGGRDQVESIPKENLSFTLGERFGDKLSKLK
ncbi:30S ribosomal S1-like protein, rpsA [Thermobacillus xylanilyticus]|jgi:small subunit ribosomal protein S1|uniref:30S ribosomal S1-like protein, rpsA n=1 Tax=Thermobacillus xylanilyticus TaxID=76633 RepID=A0ABN7S2P8_THEXY|nr:30S ribosomal protein S1 [Thermobacillus xylanilyticus]REJ13189.1 MAG: 30S ribosomal protein S1 [Paenibacillaceae bacterium]CAG5088045.1 30S ribosomal S1-like protein, rpsA [Thermobacillus xylanilyticus]